MLYKKDGKIAICETCKKLRQSCPIHANCIGWWRLDDNLPTTVVLDSLELNNGILEAEEGDPNTLDISGTGKLRRAFELGDKGDIINSYVKVPSPGDLFGGLGALTIVFWFNSHISQPENFFFSIWDAQYVHYQVSVSIHEDGGRLIILIEHANGYKSSLTTSGRGEDYWLDGEWHLVIATFDKTATLQHRLEIYIDNVLEGSASAQSSDIIALFDNYDCYISAGFYGLNVWGGRLDNVIIFDAALTETERTNLWNDGDGRVMIS